MSPEIRAPVSVEEFWRLSARGSRAELVAGQVIELVPPGLRHGYLASELAGRLREHVRARGLGIVAVEVGFILSDDPPTVRAPDVAFLSGERVPSPMSTRFFHGAPDLAVEVLSPDDRPSDTASKIGEYLRAGTQAVWILDPETEALIVHTKAGSVRFGRDEVLRRMSPVPEFELRLSELFA
jgi:Uma2 family endonuclease